MILSAKQRRGRCRWAPPDPQPATSRGGRDQSSVNGKAKSADARAEVAAEALFEARDLGKQYVTAAGPVDALKHVNLDLWPGELIVMLGPSGSGKSTLLNILGGLDRPSAGTVRFKGDDLTRLGDGPLTLYRRHHVGFVFQFYNLIPSLNAEENVALVTEIADAPMAPAAALELVGMEHRLHHFPAELSGGEQQRVAIARAIAKRPEVLLCDEPTGALDSKTGIRVLAAIQRVNREVGAATAIITHNAAIGRMADRVIRLADGRIVEDRANPTPAPIEMIEW